MKSGILLNGGAYFTDDRIKFFDHKYHDSQRFQTIVLNWEDVVKKRKIKIPTADFVVALGLKKLTRRLRKARKNPKQIKQLIGDFFVKNVSKNIPFIVLDDLNLGDEKSFGDHFRKFFLSNFNCNAFLLREYLRGKKYDKRVIPFSIPCQDYSSYAIPVSNKEVDIYFKGNASSKGRAPTTKKVRGMGFKSSLDIYKGGERSGKKIPFEEYLKSMAKSKTCLHFDGAGYCCFRYQEIASVGSIIVTPDYPFIVRNDYEDMVSCIRYSNMEDLKKKFTKVLQSSDLQASITTSSLSNFKKHHTNIARYNTFLEIVDKL